MKEVTVNELKQIQLDILKDVHAFCKAEGLVYSVAFGTLIGAVRHKGFIPWDDDIDIMMPRKDYERFCTTYGHEYYKVASTDTIPTYPIPYAKVYDSRTRVREHVEYPTEYGISVDVFPVDNVPDDPKTRSRFYAGKKRLDVLHVLKITSVNRTRSFVKNAVLAVSHVLLSVVNMRSLVRKMEKVSATYSNVDTKDAAVVACNDNTQRWILPAHIYRETIEMEFEDTKVCAPKEYHAMLTSLYGDYMQLPPEEQRVTHHHFDAWWIN